MAITVNWATRVVNVPQADLTPLGGSLYELDLDVFRLALKALEASEEGMPELDIHAHNTAVTVAGTTIARVVEIINGYTVEFEDGQYAVNLVGANSNVSEVTVVNQVSIRSFNTAGLIVTSGGGGGASAADIYAYFTALGREDEFKADVSGLASQASVDALPSADDVADAVWDEAAADHVSAGTMGRNQLLSKYRSARGPAVHINSTSTNTGTVIGIDGTFDNPVQTLAAAITIANALNIRRIVSDLSATLTLSQAFTDWEFIGGTVQLNGQDVGLCKFFGPMIITGACGANTFGAYWYDLSFFSASNIVGEFYRCTFSGNVSLIGGGLGYQFVECRSYDDDSFPTFNLAGDVFGIQYEIDFRNWKGRLAVANSTRSDNIITIDGDGEIQVLATCDAGTLRPRGAVEVVDNSTGTFTVDDDRVAVQVDTQLTSTHGAGTWTTGAGGGGGGTSNELSTFTVAAGGNALTVRSDAIEADGYFDRMLVIVESGSERMARRVRSYSQTDGAFTLESALPFVPAAGDTITVIGVTRDDPIVVGSGSAP